jgi:hypothetical protein
VAAESSALGTRIGGLLSAVEDHYVAAEQSRNADLDAIVTANPSLPALVTDRQTLENHDAATSADLGAVIAFSQTKINSLAADVATTVT